MNTALLPSSPAEPGAATSATSVPGSIRLWQAVAAAHAALTLELEADDGACPVLAAEAFAVLLSLGDAPGHRLRMRELAERSHLTPSGLTRRVDRLVVDGLLARVGCPDDRRGAFAQITPRGLDELRHALPHHAAILERYVAPCLDQREIDGLIAVLGDLAAKPRPGPGAGRKMIRRHPDPLASVTTHRGR